MGWRRLERAKAFEPSATALVESGIKATIFVTGLWLRESPVGLAFVLAHRDLFAIENQATGASMAFPSPAQPQSALEPAMWR